MTQFHQESATVLCIGGTESAGLAGLATDIRTHAQLGGHALPIVSAITAQGALPAVVEAVSPELFVSQLDSALTQATPHAIKVGLLPSVKLAETLVKWIKTHKLDQLPLVFDPVLSNTPGHALINDNPLDILNCLLPVCDLLTPNADEAKILLTQRHPTLLNDTLLNDTLLNDSDTLLNTPSFNDKATWPKATESLAKQWHSKAPNTALLLKGGHQPESEYSSDFFIDDEHQLWIFKKRLNLSYSVRGTGCTLASAIAQWLGRGFSRIDAAVLGRQALHQMLSSHKIIEQHNNSFIPFLSEKTSTFPIISLPQVSQYYAPTQLHFPECTLPSGEKQRLGIYPVVDSVEWLQRLLALGISTIQIRIKNKTGKSLRDELQNCVALAKQYNARLFINDFWELAIELGAYGVHLGQEDLLTADFSAISYAGLRLGLSSHCHFEVAQAIAINPSYMATGPVFPTTSKIMPWKNQGVEGVRHWKALLTQSGYTRPLVAIGGIKSDQVTDILQAGADSIAVISAITQANDPEKAATQLRKICS